MRHATRPLQATLGDVTATVPVHDERFATLSPAHKLSQLNKAETKEIVWPYTPVPSRALGWLGWPRWQVPAPVSKQRQRLSRFNQNHLLESSL